MVIKNVNLETVCGITSVLPKNTKPEIAFAGKSNVGKSSLMSEQEKIKWGQLIERYLHSSAQLKAVFLLIDIRHAPSENDRIMYQWIVDQGFHPIIIATKLDKIKRSQVQKQMKVLREGLKLIPGTTIIPFSSQTKQGRDEIWDMVENQFLNQ